ncbi:MAG: ABC transporter permease [Planctomycetota bacterium]|jgi:peptide/nickel transport system permease protein
MSDSKTPMPESVTGVDLMRGIGAVEAKGFWEDAWGRVVRRPGPLLAIVWIGIVAFFAVFSPVIANGLPLWAERIGPDGAVTESWSPLWRNLDATDLLLLFGTVIGLVWLLIPLPLARSTRAGMLFVAAVQAGFIVAAGVGMSAWSRSPDAPAWLLEHGRASWFPAATAAVAGATTGLLAAFVPTCDSRVGRLAAVLLVAFGAGTLVVDRWSDPLIDYESYIEEEAAGTLRATWTLVPWSPNQSRSDLDLFAPGVPIGEKVEEATGVFGERRFLMGSDAVGRDVLSQMMHACRLSISVGLVSTGIAVLIGVTIGSLMGYFGGKVDLLLYRVVEIFMAIPVLFLLIVAAAVLPRNTYVMMVIIGCVSWTGAARFIRAEFLRMRGQDFVQSARAVGLPLRSILFKHMLPNGVTPVLVDASFAIAAAILAEATLSFLGLGPEGQASWGKLLASATNTTGTFVWWLAIFPGFAIFLTVLGYNLIGEALRDAIDPKLRKAAQA